MAGVNNACQLFMKTGIISSTEVCQPVLYNLVAKQLPVTLFYAATPGTSANSQLLAFCNNYQIPVAVETTKDHIYEWLQAEQPDIVFITGYSRLLNTNRLAQIPHGAYNVHFGALPEYRGPSPVFWQLKKGEKTIDVCIHQLISKADAGPIVWRKSIPNEEHHNYTYVNQYLSHLLVEGVNQLLNTLQQGNTLTGFPQDETKAQYHSRPSLQDVVINWDSLTTAGIFNLCKACNTWNWGAMTSYKGVELKILDATVHSAHNTNKAPGTIVTVDNNLVVASVDGSCSINYLSLNGIFFPGRHAKNFGLAVDQRLGI